MSCAGASAFIGIEPKSNDMQDTPKVIAFFQVPRFQCSLTAEEEAGWVLFTVIDDNGSRSSRMDGVKIFGERGSLGRIFKGEFGCLMADLVGRWSLRGGGEPLCIQLKRIEERVDEEAA